MHPILFEIAGFKVRSFGVMVALGFLLGYWFTLREARRTRLVKEEVISDLFVWVIAGGMIGARILYVIIHWKDFAPDPIQALYIWNGGIVYYGGFLGAFLAGWIYTRRHKLSYVMLGDICLPGAMLGQSIGRIGCFLVGDDYGRPAPGLPWAVTFPDIPDSLLPEPLRGQPLHPTQLYMMLQAFLIFLVLAWLARRKRFDGQVLFTGLMLYPIGRSICEAFRGDNVERGIYEVGFLELSTSQWISIPIFLIGLAGILFMPRRVSSPPPEAARPPAGASS